MMHRFLVYPKIKYPKLVILGFSYIFAYLLLVSRHYPFVENTVIGLGYLGIFLAGIFYSYGFSAAPAASIIFMMSRNLNIFAAGTICAIGSLVGDLIIFEFIRTGFSDEIMKLSRENLLGPINIPGKIKKIVFPIIAGIFIASPLPDEIGVSMFAASKIPALFFAAISLLLNAAGIFVILYLGA